MHVHMLKRVALALVAIVVLAFALLYGLSEWSLRRGHQVPLTDIAIPHDAASVDEGGRLAKVFGCRGCHNPNGEGSVWADPPWFVASIAPPGIARKIAGYSDAEVARLIHHGVRKDGTTLFIMPTIAHRNIADDDLGKVIAWLRTVKAGPQDVTQDTTFGPLGRLMILTGQVKPSFQPGDVAPKQRPAELGKYYYDAVCSECHKLDVPQVTEDGQETAPALASTAASYPLPAFQKLLRTGTSLGGAKLMLMKDVATEATYALTDDEIAQIHAWLVAQNGTAGGK